ncbi:MAG: hypothetical protein K2X27_25885 [Candidatus Obscuribacterales bacterium]|nr:hypothetical protein [Candidatus Obscuribacterales bacterium]
MQSTRLCLSLLVIFTVSACSPVQNWIKESLLKNDDAAVKEALNTAHPVGVSFDVTMDGGKHQQISLFFNGSGLARVIGLNDKAEKTLIDFAGQEISRHDFESDKYESEKLDPSVFPCILGGRDALLRQAKCIGTGYRKGFPYHRWTRQNMNYEWEIWTDDRDSFPIYFRSIKNGEVTTWTLINAWIDESTKDKATFFTLEADPVPAAPNPEELDLQAKAKAEAEEKEKLLRLRPKRKSGKHRNFKN